MAFEHAALELLQNTAVEAEAVKVIRIDGDPDNVLISQKGSYEKYALRPKRRDHEVFDIDSLLSLADGQGQDDSGESVLWHSEDAVVLVFNDRERKDFATLKLEYAKAFSALRAMNSGKVFTQPQLVRLLKVDLDGCVPPDLLAAVRLLKFVRNEEGKSDLQHGASSLGRSVESKITGASAIPEQFLASTNVYANVLGDNAVSLRVSIDIDMEQHQFTLSVVGDDLSDAVQQTQAALGESLLVGNENRRVLFGKP